MTKTKTSAELLKCLKGLVDTKAPERFQLQEYTPLGEDQRLDSCDPATYAPQFVQPSVAEVRQQLTKQKDALIEASSKLLGPDAERDPLEKISYDEARDRRAERKKGAVQATAGRNWYNLPATQMTPDLLAQMKLIHLREFALICQPLFQLIRGACVLTTLCTFWRVTAF